MQMVIRKFHSHFDENWAEAAAAKETVVTRFFLHLLVQPSSHSRHKFTRQWRKEERTRKKCIMKIGKHIYDGLAARTLSSEHIGFAREKARVFAAQNGTAAGRAGASVVNSFVFPRLFIFFSIFFVYFLVMFLLCAKSLPFRHTHAHRTHNKRFQFHPSEAGYQTESSTVSMNATLSLFHRNSFE